MQLLRGFNRTVKNKGYLQGAVLLGGREGPCFILNSIRYDKENCIV